MKTASFMLTNLDRTDFYVTAYVFFLSFFFFFVEFSSITKSVAVLLIATKNEIDQSCYLSWGSKQTAFMNT